MLYGHSILRSLAAVALMCTAVALVSASAEAKKQRGHDGEEGCCYHWQAPQTCVEWYPDYCLEEDDNGKCIKVEHGKCKTMEAVPRCTDWRPPPCKQQ